MGFHPQIPGRDGRIDPDIPSPCRFITAAANLGMVTATEQDGELIADLAAERSALRKAKMVRIRGLAAANEGQVGRCHDPRRPVDPRLFQP